MPVSFGRRMGLATNLGAVYPRGGPKAKTIPHGVDKYERNAEAIGYFVDVVGICQWQSAVDLTT